MRNNRFRVRRRSKLFLRARAPGIVDPTDVMGTDPIPALLTAEQIATRWGVSTTTLANRRVAQSGCPYVKVGGRVLYRRDDVRAFERNGRVGPTRAAFAAGARIALRRSGIEPSRALLDSVADQIETAMRVQGIEEALR